jgi:phosphonate transport system substrate-binding protein
MFEKRRAPRFASSLAIFAFIFFSSIRGAEVLGQTPARIEAQTLTLGIVSQIHQKEIENRFRDFAGYVARKLSAAPKIEGKIIVAPTPPQLAALLAEKKVDFYMESPYPTYVINDVHDAGTLLLRRWKGGMAEYRALIFTNRNSATKRLEDLRGRIIAFEDPGSTSGYFLPKFFLSRRGFKLAEKSRVESTVSPGEIGYIFAHSQGALIDLVLSDRVAAGAFSDDDYTTLDEEKKSNIGILAETERLPRHLLSIRKDLAPPLAKRLEEILLSMHEDPEGRSILEKTDQTTKFDLLPGGEAAMRRRLLETFYSPEKR